IERLGNTLHHDIRHTIVDLARQLDEARLPVVFPALPTEVEWIDRDAVPTDARSRVERHEPEGLGSGSVDHFPDVDPDLAAEESHLIGEGDVYVPEGVLQQLDHLGHARTGDHDDLLRHPAVEGGHQLGRPWGDPADDLGGAPEPEALVAGI